MIQAGGWDNYNKALVSSLQGSITLRRDVHGLSYSYSKFVALVLVLARGLRRWGGGGRLLSTTPY